MPSPWMAGEEALKCHPATLKRAILLNGLQPVGAACGREAALGTKKRGNGALVKADNAYEYV